MAETASYDLTELYDMLDEVQGYFAELRYIDKVMERMDEAGASWVEEWVTRGVDGIEVEFGRTFPFTRRFEVKSDYFDSPFDSSHADRIRDDLPGIQSAAEEWAATEIESVRERIRPFVWPDGSRYENDCLRPVEDMHRDLNDEASDDFGLLEHTLSDWRGDAADNFASYFYYPYGDTLRSQKQMLTALLGGIASARAIAESTQHSIMDVVKKTKEALRDQLQLAQAQAELAREQSRKEALIIAGGVATVFAGILTGGAAATAVGLWAARFGVVAGATQVASTAIPEEGATPFGVEGATAEELCHSLSDAVSTIKTNDADEHDNLLTEVDVALARLEELRETDDGEFGRLIPIRPEIVDGVDGDSFYVP